MFENMRHHGRQLLGRKSRIQYNTGVTSLYVIVEWNEVIECAYKAQPKCKLYKRQQQCSGHKTAWVQHHLRHGTEDKYRIRELSCAKICSMRLLDYFTYKLRGYFASDYYFDYF